MPGCPTCPSYPIPTQHPFLQAAAPTHLPIRETHPLLLLVLVSWHRACLISPLPMFVTGSQYSCCRQYSFTHSMWFALEQPDCLQRVFISERGLSALRAAISSILTGVSKFSGAHTNLFASAFEGGLTMQLWILKIMPCPARNNPTMLWRVKFYQCCGSGLWQIAQQSPVNLGQSNKCISVQTSLSTQHRIYATWCCYVSFGLLVVDSL